MPLREVLDLQDDFARQLLDIPDGQAVRINIIG